MRARMLGIAVLVIPTLALAQTPKTSAPTKPDPRLDSLINGWANKMAATKDMFCEFERITTDAVFETETYETGEMSGVKPYFARLDLFNEKDNKRIWSQVFICNGKAIYQYEFKKKQQITYVLPDPGPNATGNKTIPGPLSLVYGMTAAEAKTRFELAYVKDISKDGTDYAQVKVTPRLPADQQEFKWATLVIDKKTFLPKQFLFIEPNGNKQDWRFFSVETNLNIPADRFGPLKNVPKDWERINNNYGEPPGPAGASKSKAAESPKSRTEAGRPVAPKK